MRTTRTLEEDRTTNGTTMRQCSKCRVWQQLSRELFAAYTTGGFKRQCRSCERARTMRWYQANRETKNAKTKAYRRLHREQFNAYRRRRTANKRQERERSKLK